MAGNRAIHAEHENIVAQNLEIVTRVVTGGQAFVMQHRLAGIRGHLEMTAKTRGRPRSVAGVARHRRIRVCETCVGLRQLRSDDAIFSHQLCPKRFRVEVRIARHDGIGRLHDFPFLVFVGHRPLYKSP